MEQYLQNANQKKKKEKKRNDIHKAILHSS